MRGEASHTTIAATATKVNVPAHPGGVVITGWGSYYEDRTC